MKVRELMSRPVMTVRSDDDVELALQIMAWAEIRHLPVMDGKRLVGIVSERSLLAHRDKNPRLDEVMSSPVQIAHPDDQVTDAACRLVRERLGCLPVVAEQQVIGMLTLTDVVSARARLSAPPAIAQRSVREVMTPQPLTVSPDESFIEAYARFAARNLRHAPVVNAENRVIGMLSDRDARSAIGAGYQGAPDGDGAGRTNMLRVRDAMSHTPVVVQDTASLSDAAALLRSRNVGALPVIDRSSRLVGILSYVDLLRELAATNAAGARP